MPKPAGPSLPGEIEVAVTLRFVSVGTESTIVPTGLPAVTPWQLAI